MYGYMSVSAQMRWNWKPSNALSKALVKRGHLVTVLTRGNFFRETERNIEGINVIELPFIALPPPLHMIFHGYFVIKN